MSKPGFYLFTIDILHWKTFEWERKQCILFSHIEENIDQNEQNYKLQKLQRCTNAFSLYIDIYVKQSIGEKWSMLLIGNNTLKEKVISCNSRLKAVPGTIQNIFWNTIEKMMIFYVGEYLFFNIS